MSVSAINVSQTIVSPGGPNQVIVDGTGTQIIEIVSVGPQGPPGPNVYPGGVQGSLQFNDNTTFSGSALFTVDPTLGMFVTGGLFVTGSVSLQIPIATATQYLVQANEFGELSFVTASAIATNIESSGSGFSVGGNATNPDAALTITAGGQPLFTIQTDGVVLFGTSSTSIVPVAGGMVFSGSNFYLGS